MEAAGFTPGAGAGAVIVALAASDQQDGDGQRELAGRGPRHAGPGVRLAIPGEPLDHWTSVVVT